MQYRIHDKNTIGLKRSNNRCDRIYDLKKAYFEHMEMKKILHAFDYDISYVDVILTDKLKCVCWITIISGLFNVIGMIVLIKIFGMGAYAIVLTTMVINSINAFFVTPFLEAYFLELKDKYIFFRIVMRHVLTTLICTVVLLLFNTLLSNKAKWLIVLFNILILGSIGVFIMGIGECKKEERGYLVNMIKVKLTGKK